MVLDVYIVARARYGQLSIIEIPGPITAVVWLLGKSKTRWPPQDPV